MHECINRLLKNESKEHNLEKLCILLTTIGKKIDTLEEAKWMNEHFESISRIITKAEESPIISKRVRYMLQDLLDLRQVENN